MANISVNSEDIKKLADNLDELIMSGEDSKDAIYKFLKSRIPKQQDIELSPFPSKKGGLTLVDSGRLRNSYGITTNTDNPYWSYTIGNKAPYASKVLKESKIPFIGVSKPLIDILENEIRKNIPKIVG